jgi:small subunit ribosomal protein S12
MPTFNQLCKHKNRRRKKRRLNRTPALQGCPQKRGLVTKLVLRAPKKPNSALRKLVKLKLTNSKRIYAHIPGESHGQGHGIRTFAWVLIRGGRVKDLPGVKYRLIRNKLDLPTVKNRKTSRSKYGKKEMRRYIILDVYK